MKLVAIFSAVLLAGIGGVHAATFTVTNTGDNGGLSPSVGAGTGTLRQAIVDVNAAGGTNTINFNITNPASGPYTIALAAQLPAISTSGSARTLTINGFSQPGSVMNTNAPDEGGLNTQLMIELVGTGGFYGFFYDCCGGNYLNLTVQGVAMHGFIAPVFGQSNFFTPKAKLTVYGCFIGTKVDGTALPTPGNSNAAVNVGYDDAQVGGVFAWQRNLLSGNGTGVLAAGPNATVIIEGNLIGTDASGTQAIANVSWPGLYLQGNLPGIRVGCTGAGCTTAASRNVISGNRTYGVAIWDTYTLGTGGMQIKGNYIGTDWSGTQPLPNGTADATCPTYCGGIQLQGSDTVATPASIIGGFGDGEANLIAYNNGPGVVSGFDRIGESFDLRGNEIHRNRNTNVAFMPTGRSANDAGDADAGANHMQNWPVIQSASVSSGNLNVTYSVDSTTANSAYPLRIDFYVDVADGSGRYLVSDSYPSGSAQVARAVSLPLPVDALPLTGFVATATDTSGYSSEFSPSHVFDRIFADAFSL